ncbi:MAG TPA: hypothetical protein V6C65_26905 [Allocoleopsis sp.]
MQKINQHLHQIRSLLPLIAAQLKAQPPIMLFTAAVWFGLVSLTLPWFLRLLLFLSPLLSGLFAVWAMVHMLFGVGKMAIGLRRARQ